ncbi:MAG: HAD-IB family phosphatase, partial [Candidatus Margulisiibacteriota bacterium]
QYFNGEISWDEFACLDAREYAGHHQDIIVHAAQKLSYINGIEETFRTLRGRGVEIAFVSSTLYQFAAWLAERFKVRHCYANPLGTDEKGILNGKIDLKVKAHSKDMVMRRLKKKLGLDTRQVAAVGDSLLDFSMFKEAGTSICVAHAPDQVKQKVDHVLPSDDLTTLCAIITG